MLIYLLLKKAEKRRDVEMKVFMIGGTGLLGSVAAQKLIEKGHIVTSLALPNVPKGAHIPEEMNLILMNYMDMSDSHISKFMEGFDVFVFAAGIDERIEGKPPIYQMFYDYNIAPLERLLKLAKKAHMKHAIIFGSYFSYFDRIWKDLDLYNNHPYIKSRVDQANMALSFADKSFSVSVLELPYIFGAQEGRKPVWVFLVEQIRKMKLFTFYPNGGTTMVTVNQVGEIVSSLVDKGKGGRNIPIGFYNLTWKEMLKIFHKNMNLKRSILTIPKWVYRLSMKTYKKDYAKRGLESGLDFNGLVDIMTRNAFIDKEHLVSEFDLKDDDIEKAIAESIKASLEFIVDKKTMVEMSKK